MSKTKPSGCEVRYCRNEAVWHLTPDGGGRIRKVCDKHLADLCRELATKTTLHHKIQLVEFEEEAT